MHAIDPSIRLYYAVQEATSNVAAFHRPHRTSFPKPLRASRSLRQALVVDRFSIMHHHALWLPSLGYAYRGARNSGCPLIISPRGMLAPYARARSRCKKWLATRLLHPGAFQGAAAWHATSEAEFRDIREAGFRQPILLSPNGVTQPTWDDERDREAWLHRFPNLRGKRLWLFYSRWHSIKGLMPLLDVWSEIHSRHPDWHLLVCGVAEEFTLPQVVARVAKLGLTERVTVADSRGLAKPYRLAELYALPTRSESFGLTIGESLASGVPVITTTEAPWEQVNERGCGVCVPFKQFSERLDALLSWDTQRLQAMGDIGRDWIATNYSWEQRAAEMLQFYNTLMQGHA